MENDSLKRFVEGIRRGWGPLDTKMVIRCQGLLEELVNASNSEPWLAALQGEIHENRELYRDAEHGFILLAHRERKGLYRNPHDHGAGWVIYAVLRGEVEMGTYGRVAGKHGDIKIVRRETYRIQAGQSRVYLPGDIHDTKCISDSVLMFRLSSCDLKKELQEKRMHRYPEQE